jgi:hypothetical protein
MAKRENQMRRVIGYFIGHGMRAGLMAAVLLVGGVLGVYALTGMKASPTVNTTTPAAVPAASGQAQLEKVVTIVRSTGFEPNSVTRTGGHFLLVVANRSGANELAFVLKRQSGEVVQQMSAPAGTLEWSREINIPAGTYTLTEANHPAWTFQITIQ